MSQVGANVSFSSDTRIGERTVIGNNVTFYPGVTVGHDCRILDGAVLGRVPRTPGNTNRPLPTEPQPLVIGDGSIIGANAVLYSGSQIGRRVLIGDLASIREGCRFADDVIFGRGSMAVYDTIIGERSRINDGALLIGEVEADVFMGLGVRCSNDNGVYLRRYGLATYAVKGPLVRRFALIGTGANLGAGVEVGMGAIVAPQAMVTRDVLPWTRVAGTPARPFGNVSDGDRRAILEHFGLPVGGERLSA